MTDKKLDLIAKVIMYIGIVLTLSSLVAMEWDGHYFDWLGLARTIAIGFHVTVVYAILRGIASIIREMQITNTKLK